MATTNKPKLDTPAPIACPCKPGCIATMRVQVQMEGPCKDEDLSAEADVCVDAQRTIEQACRLLKLEWWSAKIIAPSKQGVVFKAQPSEKTTPAVLKFDGIDDKAYGVVERYEAPPLYKGIDHKRFLDPELLKRSTALEHPPIPESIDDIETSAPLPIDDASTSAIRDPGMPVIAHRLFLLKRLAEAFDEEVGFREADVSMDRSISFSADLGEHGARHQTLQVPTTESTYTGKQPNTFVYATVNREQGREKLVFHVMRFERFFAWLKQVDNDGFQLIAASVEILDDTQHASAYRFLRHVWHTVHERAATRPTGSEMLKTALFEF